MHTIEILTNLLFTARSKQLFYIDPLRKILFISALKLSACLILASVISQQLFFKSPSLDIPSALTGFFEREAESSLSVREAQCPRPPEHWDMVSLPPCIHYLPDRIHNPSIISTGNLVLEIFHETVFNPVLELLGI